MSFLRTGMQLVALGLLAFAFLLAGAASLAAQESEAPEKLGRVKVQFPNIPDNAPPGQELSAALQEELESVIPELQGIVVLCDNACEPKSGGSAQVGSKVKDVVREPFSCVDGKCTCIGASNCVQMIARDKQCRPQSVQCTGAGCTCNSKAPERAR